MPVNGVFPPFDSPSLPHFVFNLILSIRHIRFRFILKCSGGGAASWLSIAMQIQTCAFYGRVRIRRSRLARQKYASFQPSHTLHRQSILPFLQNNFYHTKNKYADSESIVKIARLSSHGRGAATAAAEDWRRATAANIILTYSGKINFRNGYCGGTMENIEWKTFMFNKLQSIIGNMLSYPK